MPSQIVLQEKAGEVEEIKKWLVGYKSIGVASLQKVRAAQLQELKKSLHGEVYLRVMKNTLMKIALENMENADLKKLEPYLDGSNILLFTNLNAHVGKRQSQDNRQGWRHRRHGRGCSRRKHWAASWSLYQSTQRGRFAYEDRIR